MDFKDQKKSKNFKDTTGYNMQQKGLDSFLMAANPAILMRKIREKRLQEGLIPPPKTSPFGPTNINQLVLNELLSRLMKNDDLINPQVVMSRMYGDLIPEDRWDKMGYPSKKGKR
jgi:hypothetical protein